VCDLWFSYRRIGVAGTTLGRRRSWAWLFYVGFAGLALGIERVEVLFAAMLGGVPGIDGATKDFPLVSRQPFAEPEEVLRYLSRYTHRVAISNSRRRARNSD
jgi:hypothetical protein